MLTLKQSIDQINKANPFFGSFLLTKDTIGDHCKKLTSHEFDSEFLKRQKPYIALIKKKAESLFVKEDIRLNVDEGMILDTTAHHNILNFPTIVGAHLMSRFDTILNRKEHGDYYVLDCGNVTFSEVLHKRGVELQGKHINLYPKKDKNRLVSRYPLYEFDLMHWVKNSGHTFTHEELTFVEHLQEIIDDIDFSTCKRFSDQIVKINHRLWLEFFDPEIVDDVRRCITLEHDEILSEFLTTFFRTHQDTIISQAIFDPDFRQVILEEFNGIYGAWNYSGEGTGTYFFWAVTPGDGKEKRLELHGDTLIEPGGSIREIKLTPEDVAQALEEDIITPAIFTKFGLVDCYLGAKVMGGPGQTEYVGKLHDAWERALERVHHPELALVKKGSVLNMNCGDVAYSKIEDGKIFHEWGWDIAMHHRFTREYLQALAKTPFKYAVYPAIPISYYRLTPAEERQEVQYNEQELYQGFNWVQ